MNEEDIFNAIDKKLDNIDLSLEDVYNNNIGNDISELVHKQNEEVIREKMKKELISSLEELNKNGANIEYSEDMSYETLEKILNENK